jgi:hypothetical protein
MHRSRVGPAPTESRLPRFATRWIGIIKMLRVRAMVAHRFVVLLIHFALIFQVEAFVTIQRSFNDAIFRPCPSNFELQSSLPLIIKI